jgi:FkbM family methyltransferase
VIRATVEVRTSGMGGIGSGAHMSLREAAIVALATLTRRVQPRGTDRVLRLLHDPDRRGWSVRRVVETRSNGRFHLDTASFLEWYLFFYGDYARLTTRTVLACVRPDSQAIDVGANIGTFTFAMASAVGPRGRVVACEPNPAVYGRLVDNVELNGAANVTTCPIALSDRPGEARLWVPDDRDADQGTSRLGRPAGSLRADTGSVPVELGTVDRLASRLGLGDVSFLKIDVEGYEAAVLAGARGVLRDCRPSVLFEHNWSLWQAAGQRLEDVLADLRTLGYREFGCIPSDRVGYLPLADERDASPHANVGAHGRRPDRSGPGAG